MPDVRWRVNVDVPTQSAKAAGAAVKDLDDKLRDTHGSSKKLSDEVQKLQAKLRELKAPQEIRRLNKEIEETEKHHHKAGGAIHSVIRLLGLEAAGFHSVGIAASEARASTHEFLEFIGAEVALEVLKELGEKLFDIGEEAVRAAAKAQRMNRVINLAAGGEEAGENTRKWLEKFSKTSEFSEAANESAYVRLKRVGVGQQQAGLFMKAAADVAAVSEDKNEAYQAAIGAFETIQSRGKVGARQLKPLGIGVNDIKALGGKYGHMDVKQLNAVLESGTFDQNDIFKLVMSRTHEKNLGTRSADNVDLLSTKMEKLSELPDRFYKKLADTKAVGTLGKAFDDVLTKFDPESPAGAKVFGALENIMTELANDVAGIDFDGVAATLKDDVIPAIRDMIDLLGPAMKLVEKTVGFLHTAFEGGKVAVKAISDPLGAGADVIHGKGVQQSAYDKLGSKGALPSQQEPDTLASNMIGSRSVFGKYTGINYLRDTVLNPDWWSTKSGEAQAGGAEVGQAAGAGMSEGLSSSTNDVAAASAGMSSAAPEAARQSLKVQSPSRVFEEIGEMTAAGMAKGIGGGASDVAVATDAMVAIPGARGGAGGPISVTVNVGGIALAHGGKAEGEAAADAFEKRIRGMIVDVLEQAQQGGGN